MALAQHSDPILAMQGVAVKLGRQSVLYEINLQIRPREILTIIGPNGAGKTTLLRAITGAVPIHSGQLKRPPHRQIGYVPQSLWLDASMPVNVARFLALPVRHSCEETHAALSATGIAHLLNTPMQELSGGHFRRVLLARALLGHPSLLLLDEPTRGLDPPGIAAFYELVAALRERTGCAILMVSHDLHVVMGASDRIVCLNGHICCEGTPENVSSAPEYHALFGQDTEGTLALYRHAHDHQHNGVHTRGIPPAP